MAHGGRQHVTVDETELEMFDHGFPET
jgi:hypothetical protein